jgi:alpha-D-ribose 1-methylphosphonate 5-triphosphate synthase subunit PhnL
MKQPAIEVRNLCKTFMLHQQGGVKIEVLRNAELTVYPGECIALHGASGTGKSTLLRSLYGNYKADSGQILMRHDGSQVDLVGASPHKILQLRLTTLGYVSQFLRVIPRVPALDIVAEPLLQLGASAERAHERAALLLTRLHVPQRLWSLAPATFSGGEQQRVNIARGLIVDYPILLLDEPTAALDAENREVVIELIDEARSRGAAVVGIFHDAEVRAAVSDRLYVMQAPDASP